MKEHSLRGGQREGCWGARKDREVDRGWGKDALVIGRHEGNINSRCCFKMQWN